jgi:hypothetical protein
LNYLLPLASFATDSSSPRTALLKRLSPFEVSPFFAFPPPLPLEVAVFSVKLPTRVELQQLYHLPQSSILSLIRLGSPVQLLLATATPPDTFSFALEWHQQLSCRLF